LKEAGYYLKIVFSPIGYVRTSAVGDAIKDNVVSQIVLQFDLVEGLEGVEAFSHLFVLFT